MGSLSREKWGFLTNHALVLVYVVLHPDSTVREISAGVGITERATLAIMRDLDADAIIERRRSGRRNTYAVNFAHLAAVRRGGVRTPLTPRLFVDTVVRMLFTLSPSREAARAVPPPVPADELEPRLGTWGFFTNHLLVLLQIARSGSRTVRELAASVGITERATAAILRQLQDARVLVVRRDGRHNVYAIDLDAFRDFPRWTFGTWPLPQALIDVATDGVRGLIEAHAGASLEVPSPDPAGGGSAASTSRTPISAP